MLGEPVSGADHVELVTHRGVLIHRRLELLNHRIILLLRMQHILHRTFDGFVMFGEGSIGERGQRRKDPSNAFWIHDERAHVVLGIRVRFEIRHVVSLPKLCRLVPPNLLARRIVRLSRGIARSPVVQHPAIRRPRPRPVLVDALA